VIERNRRPACCPIIGDHGLRKESIEIYFADQMIKKTDDESEDDGSLFSVIRKRCS
jgi:hypothetical protein